MTQKQTFDDFALIMTVTFDLLSSKSNPFNFVYKSIKAVKLAQAVYKMLHSETSIIHTHRRMENNPKT